MLLPDSPSLLPGIHRHPQFPARVSPLMTPFPPSETLRIGARTVPKIAVSGQPEKQAPAQRHLLLQERSSLFFAAEFCYGSPRPAWRAPGLNGALAAKNGGSKVTTF